VATPSRGTTRVVLRSSARTVGLVRYGARENQMTKSMAVLLAVSALSISGCAFGPRPFASGGSGYGSGNDRCRYNDSAYAQGSTTCQSGVQYRCEYGRWQGRGVACGGNQSASDRGCNLNGNSYSPGAAVCQADTQYRCDDGAWRSLQVACRGGDRPRTGRTCVYKGATVATQSTICKSGSTFLCDGGEWRDLGSACR
jgi:hypothetical protein